jgi:chaperone modulatory protein CbpM
MISNAGNDSEIAEMDETCTLEELCDACSVEANWVVELIEHGVVEPVGRSGDWYFARVSIIRVAKAKRLERDLSLNLPGIALALDLLEEIEGLRSRLRMLEKPPRLESGG